MSEQALFLENITGVTLGPASVEPGINMRCARDRIVAIGAGLTPEPGDEVVDLEGALVMPGLVVGHHHLYSALARGMPFPAADPPRDFHDTLKKIWWRLDRALDSDTVYLSALAGAMDAARFGVTAVVDHHASPMAVAGSLDEIARGLGEVGVRGLLCYEVSDRDGPKVARAGVEENRRFVAARAEDQLFRGMIGAHASFTIGDETLDSLARVCQESGAGLHIHLLEDAVDRTASVDCHGQDPVRRLQVRGLLGDRALCAHGVHLTAEEAEILRDARVFVAHNARSNMNNRVGAARVGTLGDRVVLGTDGIDGDILSEARAAFFRGREHQPPLDLGQVVDMLTGAGALLQSYFGVPFGRLEPGAMADLVVLGYDPPTPLTRENLAGHVGFGWGAHLVRSVIVGGRFVFRDRSFVHIDEAEAAARTREGAARLWSRL